MKSDLPVNLRLIRISSFLSSVFICVHLWFQHLSVRRLRAAGRLRARDFAVGFRAAVAVELPGGAHFLDLVEIQIGHEQFILVAAGLRDNLPTWIAEVTLS